jgi:DNA mismatch repair protein MSH4
MTAQSRPTTARPQTAASTGHESHYITAVFEGRGVAREVGLAALNRETGHVMIVQVRYKITAIQTFTRLLSS